MDQRPGRICRRALAAELFAAAKGADFIRTHEPAPLRDALKIWAGLEGNRP